MTAKQQADRRWDAVVDSIATTLEWLITAFILAFVFRAFVMEAFRIPTGSMADTLKGAHFQLRCPQCGYEYDYNFQQAFYSAAWSQEYIPPGDIVIRPPGPRCPSCGYFLSSNIRMPVANGDRILVLKTIYQFFEPDRWDVIVFKNPTDPRINYIKRLIAKPGETLEIIDGDIYINGKICRKPPKVQEELWMPVYNNDYRPIQPEEGHFNGHSWRQPFKNISDSQWQLADANNPMLFTLDSPPNKVNTVTYDTSVGNNFQAAYAYDDPRSYEFMPTVSDLKVKFYADCEQPEGVIGAVLSKYETLYRAWMNLSGEMIIIKSKAGAVPVELARKQVGVPATGRNIPVEFANVDHRLIFKFGDETLTYDLGRDPNSAGPRVTNSQPQVSIFGSGKLVLSHIAVFRDIHYLGRNNLKGVLRASEGNPITLRKDEFFAMGDNSPSSSDSRYWESEGLGNGPIRYRPGIVPRDYLIGKALFVYWPSGFGFSPFVGTRFSIVPNVGAMRFIYGGKEGYN
jgi:signal peptidase I